MNDIANRLAESPRLDRLDEVHLEASLQAQLPVFFRPVTGEGDRRGRAARSERTQQIQPGAITQLKVADDQVVPSFSAAANAVRRLLAGRTS